MDEPFGAVDPLTRDRLQREFLRHPARLRKTVVFVTHDIDEAVRLGDRIAIMREGRLVQYDIARARPRVPGRRVRRRLRGRRARAQAALPRERSSLMSRLRGECESSRACRCGSARGARPHPESARTRVAVVDESGDRRGAHARRADVPLQARRMSRRRSLSVLADHRAGGLPARCRVPAALGVVSRQAVSLGKPTGLSAVEHAQAHSADGRDGCGRKHALDGHRYVPRHLRDPTAGRDFYDVVSDLANFGQTFPPIAVLTLSVPLLGFGFEPTVFALTLYRSLPCPAEHHRGHRGGSAEHRRECPRDGTDTAAGAVPRRAPRRGACDLRGRTRLGDRGVATATIGATIGAGGLGAPIIRGWRTPIPRSHCRAASWPPGSR